MSFQLSPELERNKVFLVMRSELEGRLDPFCYIPELVTLDNKIKSKTNYCLKDFSNFRASGATPSKSHDEYYSDKKNGIPFIRVQNLSTTGELDQSDLVYISKDVHNGLLKRSQIKEHDLLVKITGVGRMAVASIAPDGFEGNINQHIVVVRTGSKEISENIAFFLNLDAVEKIATRRATGGTRPALDYPALFSIPVINDRSIYIKIMKAVVVKKQKEAEAQRLLDSVDGYLLGELGIELPEQEENTLQGRMFTRQLSEITGGRFDPNYRLNIKLITGHRANYDFVKLKDIIKYSPQYGANEPAVDGIRGNGARYIRITDITEIGELNNNSWKTAETTEDQYLLHYNDLLFARSGSVGRAYLHKDITEDAIFAGYLIRFILDEEKADPDYIFFYCHSVVYKLWVNAIYRPALQANINAEEYKSMPVALPFLEKQTEIASHIKKIRNQAKQLQQQAKAGLEQAKKEVEAIILGEK